MYIVRFFVRHVDDLFKIRTELFVATVLLIIQTGETHGQAQ